FPTRAISQTAAGLSVGRRELAHEVVEELGPSLFVRADGCVIPESAVSEADGGHSSALLEVDLDQRFPWIVVPDPRERQAGWRLDLGVGAAAAVLDVLARVAHNDTHRAADAQVDLGLGRLPGVAGVPPA